MNIHQSTAENSTNNDTNESDEFIPHTLARVLPLEERHITELLREWLTLIARCNQVPLEYVSVPAIVGLSILLARRVAIAPKRKNR